MGGSSGHGGYDGDRRSISRHDVRLSRRDQIPVPVPDIGAGDRQKAKCVPPVFHCPSGSYESSHDLTLHLYRRRSMKLHYGAVAMPRSLRDSMNEILGQHGHGPASNCASMTSPAQKIVDQASCSLPWRAPLGGIVPHSRSCPTERCATTRAAGHGVGLAVPPSCDRRTAAAT